MEFPVDKRVLFKQQVATFRQEYDVDICREAMFAVMSGSKLD
jgi:hypothetical protein